MFDIKAVEAEAAQELNEERMKRAKAKIKASLQTVERARAVLANALEDHEAVKREAAGDFTA